MKGSLNHLSHKYINPIEVGIRIEAIIEVELGIIIILYRGCPLYNQNFKGRARGNFNNRGSYDIIFEEIRDIEIITTITEGMVIAVKVTTEIEVGH